jgi:hypothetical protein
MKERKRRPRTRPVEPITAQCLRELFTKHVLRGPLKMPDDAELEKLAGILEHRRGEFQWESYSRDRRALQDNVFIAFRAASDKLMQFDKAELKAATTTHVPEHALFYLRARLAESIDFRVKVERFGALIDSGFSPDPALTYAPPTYGATGWKWLAEVLPDDFVVAMRSNNPTFDPGISHAGPVPRFIAAVVPLITGEQPTVQSVATQLKTRQKARNASGS